MFHMGFGCDFISACAVSIQVEGKSRFSSKSFNLASVQRSRVISNSSIITSTFTVAATSVFHGCKCSVRYWRCQQTMNRDFPETSAPTVSTVSERDKHLYHEQWYKLLITFFLELSMKDTQRIFTVYLPHIVTTFPQHPTPRTSLKCSRPSTPGLQKCRSSFAH